MDNTDTFLMLTGCPLKFDYADEAEGATFDEIDGNEEIINMSRIIVFTNEEKHITIICEQFRCNGEEWFNDTTEVINCIYGEAYDKLIDYINSAENIIVHIQQVFDATSDYTIYTNSHITSYREFIDDICPIYDAYKYNIVDNGKIKHFI